MFPLPDPKKAPPPVFGINLGNADPALVPIEHNDFWQNIIDVSGVPAPGPSNLLVEPQFINKCSLDLTLHACSPLKNAGLNTKLNDNDLKDLPPIFDTVPQGITPNELPQDYLAVSLWPKHPNIGAMPVASSGLPWWKEFFICYLKNLSWK